MKRIAEKVLSIIGLVFTVLSIIGGSVFLLFLKTVTSDVALRKELELEFLADPQFATEDVEMIMWWIDSMEGFGWSLVILLVISLIATIVGIIFMWNNKNTKLAGAMFIVSGLFAFILSPTSILLYIAGILCFTRKATLVDESSFVEENFEDTMRPL